MAEDFVRVLRECVADDAQIRLVARRRFQERYGHDLYSLCLRMPRIQGRRELESVHDFSLYIMEDRLFRRLQNFKGECPFLAYVKSVLYKPRMGLFWEWLQVRRRHEEPERGAFDPGVYYGTDAETDAPDPNGEESEMSAREPQQSPENDFSVGQTDRATECARRIVVSLAPQEQLLLKLFFLIEYHPNREDMRLLAEWSHRSFEDTQALVAEVIATLRRTDRTMTELREKLDHIFWHILSQQRKLRTIEESSSTSVISPAGQKSEAYRTQVENELTKLYTQRKKVLEKMHQKIVTTPYTDLARLLNTSKGNAGSLVSRLRHRLREQWEACLHEKGGS